MSLLNYIHAIQINTDECVGCSHCMRVCPTQAIRIIDGNARISPERCVDCGECFRVCPQGAIYVKDDGLFTDFAKYPYRIALIPSIFFGQYPHKYSVSQIKEIIKQLGFNEVFEVEYAVDLLKEIYKEEASDENLIRPAVSSYCPSVIRLIQVMFPSLTENILSVKAPHDIAAIYLRNRYSSAAIDPKDIGIYYFTPCASKIVAAKSPVAEVHSPIDVVVNMRELYNIVYKAIVEKKSPDYPTKTVDNLSADSIKWSLSGDEKNYFTGRSLAIDGVENVIEFLEKFELGQIDNVDFLEMRVCDQGCAGGILCPSNRFLTVERIGDRYKKMQARQQKGSEIENPLVAHHKKSEIDFKTDAITPRKGLLLDESMEIALQKISKINKINSYLPGFDCGACGAPSCNSLAEDIVKGIASMSHCVFVQRVMEKNYKLSPEQAFAVIEKVWGKNSLKKYKEEYEN